jgi:glycerophosphoryl diester phosphodiesterase
MFLIIVAQVILLTGFDASCLDKGSKHYIDPHTAQKLREIFHYTGDSVSFLSSHRGGPVMNLPENCIATFANTLKYTFSIMEIDPRYTKDSIMILHHDPTLQRTTTGKGRVSDFTLKELKKLRLKDTEGNVTRYRIPTLEEVLKWANGKAILLLDKKDVPIETRIKIIEDYKAEAYTIVMAYTFEEAKQCYRLNKNIMMQVFISSPEKVREFDQTGVPWENIVAFVGHKKPDDPAVFQMIHQKGALCILGTSRNLDREYLDRKVTNIKELENGYNALYRDGADILETDIPVQVSKVVAKRLSSKPKLK